MFIKDGRTCYRLAKRSQLADLVQRSPTDDSHRSIDAEVAWWDSQARTLDFVPVRLRYIGKGAISCVEEDPRQPAEPITRDEEAIPA